MKQLSDEQKLDYLHRCAEEITQKYHDFLGLEGRPYLCPVMNRRLYASQTVPTDMRPTSDADVASPWLFDRGTSIIIKGGLTIIHEHVAGSEQGKKP